MTSTRFARFARALLLLGALLLVMAGPGSGQGSTGTYPGAALKPKFIFIPPQD